MEWLEQCLGSAVRYIQDNADGEPALYFDDLPEDFSVPALYFPVPTSRAKKATFDTYLNTIYFEAWFIASTDWLAQGAAATVRDCLMLDDCCISIINKDGTLAGKAYRTSEPETVPLDTGIVRLSFQIRNYFSKSKEAGEKVNKINISGLIKPKALYQAWFNATEEQRKDEEVQKECLQKALENL